MKRFLVSLLAVATIAVGVAIAANVPWSNSTDFPLLGTPSGTENLVGFKTGANFKVPLTTFTTTVSLTASQINHLFSAPQTVLAAPGAGKAIVPIFVEWYNHVGTVPTGSPGADAGNIILSYQNGSGRTVAGDGGLFEVIASSVVFSSSTPGGYGPITAFTPGGAALFSDISNQSLVISNSVEDYIKYGAILTSSVTAGNAGTGYVIGDTGQVTGYGFVTDILARYVVDTVDGGGAVLTYHLTSNGAGYKTGTTGNATSTSGAQPGIGTGFQIDVNSVTPGDGSGQLVLTYKIVTLP